MAADRNRLGEETSPYLLQHKDNPVHWQAWGKEALGLAKAENKPILLSVGYAACHWCHVMAHESFESADIAGLMNELYVNIKVDREERPDLDTIYQHALALMGEQGGWPLTMFLTPEGEPFWGGTYFPPSSRWGRPGFPDVLRAIANAWASDPEKVQKNVAALKEGLGGLAKPQAGGALPPALLDQVAERLTREVDPFNGGIGDAPKFPQVGIFDLLWRGWRRTKREPIREGVLRTLDAISQGGIYDHLGGGFARYSVDARWLVPHFEKMLYDNAQLVELLTLVWQETRSPLYEQRVAETIDWVTREMVTSGGGFASSLDADSEHEEGKFYVWSEAEIDKLLGARAALFKQQYDVSGPGNWEEKNILNRLKRPLLRDQETEGELAACRAILFRAREERIRPGLDDKVLADWNGLMIAALAFAGAVFERPDWIDLGREAFDFIRSDMMDGATQRLSHSWREGKARHPATVDDYANLARAALALHEATGDDALLRQAEAWIGVLDRHYADPEGGYFFAADDTEALLVRTKTAGDSAVPAGNGTLVGVFARLWHLTGKDEYRARAERIIETFSGGLQRNFFPLAGLLNGADTLMRAVQIVIRGERGAADTDALVRAALGVSLPTRVLAVLPASADLPSGHPAQGKGQVGGRATAYVCEGPVCSLPFTEPEKLAEDLRGR